MKRLLAGLLCAAMFMTIIPISFIDKDTTDQTTQEEQEVIEELTASASDAMVGSLASSDLADQVTTATNEVTETGSSEPDSSTTPEPDTSTTPGSEADSNENQGPANGKLLYLSDIPTYKMLKASVGWGTYTRDKNLDGKTIKLKISNSEYREFQKGITAHANADLQFDLGEKYNDYDYFESYIGVDAYRNGNGQVVFHFYMSHDGKNWVEQEYRTPNEVSNSTWPRFKGNTDARHIKLSLKDPSTGETEDDQTSYRYFKVYVDKDGADTADHSTLADAKFRTNEDFVKPTIDFLHAPSYYADIIKNHSYGEILQNDALELALLQYRFMKLYNYDPENQNDKLTYFLTNGENNAFRVQTFQWLFNDLEALRELMNGGVPANSNYIGMLEVLTDLYAVYKDDMNDPTALKAPDTEHESDTRGDLYRRMMFTMSIVCADGLGAWLWNAGVAKPVYRYAYFKENYLNNKLRNEIFENLGVDEMRWVLGNNISDAEIVWLNDYARAHPRGGNQTSYPIIYSPHHHIKYQWYDYNKDYLHTEENRELYTEKYMLKEEYAKYGLTYGLVNGEKVQRIWHVFEDGAVCGNISRTGANLAASFGVPACEVGQPGHAAFLIMNRKNTGEMTWGIDNDISGMTQSGNSRRMPADWGNQSDTSGYNVPYIMISQAALNEYDNYRKSEEVLMLYDLATTQEEKIACCNAALGYLPYNLDAWRILINLYINDSTKTMKELVDLSERLCSKETKMYLYPWTLTDLVKKIQTRMAVLLNGNRSDVTAAQKALDDAIARGASEDALQSLRNALATKQEILQNAESEVARCNIRLQEAYRRAQQATASDTAQPDMSKYLANYFIGADTYQLASFSFDGENAGRILFSPNFSSVRFKICLNHNESDPAQDTWSDSISLYAENGKQVIYELSQDQLAGINATSDILIWLDGWSGSNGNPEASKAFKIDIIQGSAVSGIEFNDNENRFYGTINALEYSTDGGNTWNNLTNETEIPGAHTLLVHKKASGTTLQGPDATYTIKEDNTTSRSYIKNSRLTVAAYSSEEASRNDYARHVIDGTSGTRWHTLWNGSDNQKYITLKASEPTYFSGLDYTPAAGNGNGNITAGQIYVSNDGVSWIPVKTISGWPDNANMKSVSFTPTYGQYLKLKVTASHGGFVAAKKIELFEDLTIANKQIIGIQLLTFPTKTQYIVGEKLDLSGASAKLIFSDNTYTILPVEMLTVNTKVLSTPGSQAITLTYGSYAPVTFHVTVREETITPTSIQVVQLPGKLEYYAGDALSKSGMIVTATDGNKTIYLNEDEYELTGNLSEEGTQRVTVTMKATGLTATYEITVKKAIKSIAVTAAPEKLFYELGDSLDVTGLVITATYADDTTAELSEEMYYMEGVETFSEEDGNPVIPVVLVDKHSIQTSFQVMVYPYFGRNGVRYSADKTTMTCQVTSIESTDEVVTIPETVRFGSRVYTITGIGTNVMQDSSQVKSVVLPGTITDIEDYAFFDCPRLEKVYLTAHTGFNDLKVAQNSFNTDIQIVLYAASEQLSTELGSRPFAEDMSVGNVASQIERLEITPPDVTTVSRGSTPDFKGYAVTAILTDGTRVPLDKTTCSAPSVDTTSAGEKTVTITLQISEDKIVSGNFTMTVQNSNLSITKNPEGAVYYTSDTVVQPLSVEAVSDGRGDTYEYQWYRSNNGAIDYEADLIQGATQQNYIPTENGFYYAQVIISGTTISVFSLPAEISIGDYVALIGSKGYDSLPAAVTEASPGATIQLLKDVTLTSTINIGKNLTIQGNEHTVIRGKDFTGTMFNITAGNVEADFITLDGGAGWYGEIHSQLQRGCLSSGTIAKGPIVRISNSATITFNSAALQNNYNMAEQTKSTTGGAIYAENAAKIVLNDTKILDNYSYLFGSAVYHRDNTQLTINGKSMIHGNSGNATYNTSAICADNNGVLTINGGSFCHNVGTAKGGVIWASNGSVTINGGTFEDNISTVGEALYLNGSARVTVNGYEEMEEIYLASATQTITIGSDKLPAGSLSVVTSGKSANVEVIKLAQGVNPSVIQNVVTINDKAPGVNASGSITVPCTSHTESTDYKVKKEATCKEKGEKYTYCTNCGAQMNTVQVECIPHTPVDMSEEKATCTHTGTTAGTMCSVCNTVLSGMETIQVTPHNHVASCSKNPTCTEEGETCYTCSCGDTYCVPMTALGHDMVLSITQLPTFREEGIEHHQCSRCDVSYDVSLPRLSYTPGDVNGDGVVNMKDVVRLMKYQVGENVTVIFGALDINGDQSNNMKDIVRLLRFNAGEQVELH